MMPAGQRHRLVTIQQLTETRSASSKAPVESWSSLRNVYAGMRPSSGRERFAAEQVSSSISSVWEVPYHVDMDPERVDVPKTRRLVFEGRTYDIVYAEPLGVRDGVALTTVASTRVTS